MAANNLVFTSEKDRMKANKDIVTNLQDYMDIGKDELDGLRNKLSATYWSIIILSIIMFFIGVILLSVPFIAAFNGRIKELQSLIAAGFGIADLAALFLFRPIERMHGIMGDMSQIIMALNSYQTQVGLRILEMNTEKRDTFGIAADKISTAASDSIKLIEEYFEKKE